MRLAFHFAILAPAAIPAAVQATAPVASESEATRIVAASPMREIHRAWTQCIDEAIFIANINGMSVSQIEAIVGSGCDGYESRLHGELIKRFGYNKGNGVIASLKRANRQRFQAIINSKAVTPKTTYMRDGNRTVVRRPDGHCTGMISSGKLVEPTDTMIFFDHGQWRINFIKEISYASRYSGQMGSEEVVVLTAVSRGNPIASRARPVRLEVDARFIAWSMPFDEAVASWLDGSTSVQFVALTEEQRFPRAFPVEHIADLWRDVKACTAHS